MPLGFFSSTLGDDSLTILSLLSLLLASFLVMVVCPPKSVEGGLEIAGLTGGGGLPDSVNFFVKLLTMLFNILGLVLLLPLLVVLISLGIQGLTALGLLVLLTGSSLVSFTCFLTSLGSSGCCFFLISGIVIGSILGGVEDTLFSLFSGFKSIFSFFSLGGVSSSSSLVSILISSLKAGFKVGGF